MSINQIAISKALNSPDAKSKFQELLGKRSTQFITSVLATVNNSKLLQNATWESIYQASITAATLDLPINQNLGFAYIVPYGREAQFQIGYKGFVQLAQRTGLYKTINVTDVREGEIEEYNRLTGAIKFNWIQDDSERIKKKVIGYVSYFELLAGFSKLLYMTIEQVNLHKNTYSQSGKKGFGPWKDNFDAMAKKTVLKQLLSHDAPLSVEMQTAIISDQAVLKDDSINYADNQKNTVDVDSAPKKSELHLYIEEEVETLDALEKVFDKLATTEELAAYETKKEILSKTPDNNGRKSAEDV